MRRGLLVVVLTAFLPLALAGSDELSLQNGEIAVSCTFRNQYSGQTGVGTPVPGTSEAGQFWFTSPTNTEVFVKALDFGSDRPYLLFWGGLTDLEYTVEFRQTRTGQVVSFVKEAGSTCGGVDTTTLVNPPDGAREVTLLLPGNVPLVLVRIPAGTFSMGSPPDERGRDADEGPVHAVTLTGEYYLGKYEVTQAQWRAVMGTSMPAVCGNHSVGDDFPAYCLSWNDVAGPGGFVERLRTLTGDSRFRLPTEAEWERAARAGSSTRFSFGDALDCDDGTSCPPCAPADPYVLWCGNDQGHANPVGRKLPNAYGLHDMHGNVWEWVEDRYDAAYYTASPAIDPVGPPTGNFRVLRSGGFYDSLKDARSAARMYNGTNYRYNILGFRIARSR